MKDTAGNRAEALEKGLEVLGLTIDAPIRERMLGFLDLLAKWNRAYNLTAVRDADQMVARQLLDSLSILPWIGGDRVLDVGAGGGLPGIPLALARPDVAFTLLDSNSKKTRFLLQCKLELGLDNMTPVQSRAEAFRPSRPFNLITSRAFTALPNLVRWCDHLLAPEGRFLAMKGRFPDDEVAALPADWCLEASPSVRVPGCEAQRHLLIIGRVRHSGV